jgi:2'-5' RNA ligase
VNPLPRQMANHWWQRPGRLPGRMLYQWHLAFHDQPKVIELAEMAQARLKGLPGLDMVAPEFLHLTTLIVGFADEIQESTVEKMVSGVRERLAPVPPIPVTLGRVGYHPQAVTLVVEPVDALNPLLAAVREATDAAGCEGYTDTNPWIPHISVAYSHSDGPAAPIIDALGRWLPKTEVTIKSISLVSQTQVGHSWQWQPVAEVRLAAREALRRKANADS